MRDKDFDFMLAKELDLTINNEGEIYNREGWLAKNYARQWKKGVFNFSKAQRGVKNLIVTPFVRNYQKEWKIKVPPKVRDAVSKARLRTIMRRIREGEY